MSLTSTCFGKKTHTFKWQWSASRSVFTGIGALLSYRHWAGWPLCGHSDMTKIILQGVFFFKAVIPVHWWYCYHSLPNSGAAVCSWMLVQAAVVTMADVPMLTGVQSNPWAQAKLKASLFELVWMVWDVLCSLLVCYMSQVSQQKQAVLDCIPGAAQHHQLITRSCAHQIQFIFREMALAQGVNFLRSACGFQPHGSDWL